MAVLTMATAKHGNEHDDLPWQVIASYTFTIRRPDSWGTGGWAAAGCAGCLRWLEEVLRCGGAGGSVPPAHPHSSTSPGDGRALGARWESAEAGGSGNEATEPPPPPSAPVKRTGSPHWGNTGGFRCHEKDANWKNA